ncbi:GNAT family N-acetyltransferase [Hyunsoonleella rubra]|uniref:GNAT family N-acetyltransferase n=1 Tax=Hyunsoonleella rubra TaxID=1737062 RepID=A0ABW5T785_9FLAO
MIPAKIIEVTPNNVEKETLFCIKDMKKPEAKSKQKWFEKRYKEGLKLKILKDANDKMLGFIEYIPASNAWRPVEADNFMFIHCMYIYAKKHRNLGLGAMMLKEAENDAMSKHMDGLCVMTSKGSWMADKRLFEKHGFNQVDARGRFELMSKKWNAQAPDPSLIDWTTKQQNYMGWHLLYADQCPWHEKSVEALLNVAMDHGIDLKITKINTAQEAKNAPSGYGGFNLLYNGKLLEDHYISNTRFRNIIRKVL